MKVIGWEICKSTLFLSELFNMRKLKETISKATSISLEFLFAKTVFQRLSSLIWTYLTNITNPRNWLWRSFRLGMGGCQWSPDCCISFSLSLSVWLRWRHRRDWNLILFSLRTPSSIWRERWGSIDKVSRWGLLLLSDIRCATLVEPRVCEHLLDG